MERSDASKTDTNPSITETDSDTDTQSGTESNTDTKSDTTTASKSPDTPTDTQPSDTATESTDTTSTDSELNGEQISDIEPPSDIDSIVKPSDDVIDVELLDEELTGDVHEEVLTMYEHFLASQLRVQQLQDEVEETREQLKNERQDFKSYKKQQEKQLEQQRQQYISDVFTDLVSVHQDLHRALNTDDDSADKYSEGMKMILRNFEEILNDYGVTVIQPSVGDELDTRQHEVVTSVPSDTVETDCIVEIDQLGYMFEGSVITESRVVISE